MSFPQDVWANDLILGLNNNAIEARQIAKHARNLIRAVSSNKYEEKIPSFLSNIKIPFGLSDNNLQGYINEICLIAVSVTEFWNTVNSSIEKCKIDKDIATAWAEYENCEHKTQQLLTIYNEIAEFSEKYKNNIQGTAIGPKLDTQKVVLFHALALEYKKEFDMLAMKLLFKINENCTNGTINIKDIVASLQFGTTCNGKEVPIKLQSLKAKKMLEGYHDLRYICFPENEADYLMKKGADVLGWAKNSDLLAGVGNYAVDKQHEFLIGKIFKIDEKIGSNHTVLGIEQKFVLIGLSKNEKKSINPIAAYAPALSQGIQISLSGMLKSGVVICTAALASYLAYSYFSQPSSSSSGNSNSSTPTNSTTPTNSSTPINSTTPTNSTEFTANKNTVISTFHEIMTQCFNQNMCVILASVKGKVSLSPDQKQSLVQAQYCEAGEKIDTFEKYVKLQYVLKDVNNRATCAADYVTYDANKMVLTQYKNNITQRTDVESEKVIKVVLESDPSKIGTSSLLPQSLESSIPTLATNVETALQHLTDSEKTALTTIPKQELNGLNTWDRLLQFKSLPKGYNKDTIPSENDLDYINRRYEREWIKYEINGNSELSEVTQNWVNNHNIDSASADNVSISTGDVYFDNKEIQELLRYVNRYDQTTIDILIDNPNIINTLLEYNAEEILPSLAIVKNTMAVISKKYSKSRVGMTPETTAKVIEYIKNPNMFQQQAVSSESTLPKSWFEIGSQVIVSAFLVQSALTNIIPRNTLPGLPPANNYTNNDANPPAPPGGGTEVASFTHDYDGKSMIIIQDTAEGIQKFTSIFRDDNNGGGTATMTDLGIALQFPNIFKNTDLTSTTNFTPISLFQSFKDCVIDPIITLNPQNIVNFDTGPQTKRFDLKTEWSKLGMDIKSIQEFATKAIDEFKVPIQTVALLGSFYLLRSSENRLQFHDVYKGHKQHMMDEETVIIPPPEENPSDIPTWLDDFAESFGNMNIDSKNNQPRIQ